MRHPPCVVPPMVRQIMPRDIDRRRRPTRQELPLQRETVAGGAYRDGTFHGTDWLHRARHHGAINGRQLAESRIRGHSLEPYRRSHPTLLDMGARGASSPTERGQKPPMRLITIVTGSPDVEADPFQQARHPRLVRAHHH